MTARDREADLIAHVLGHATCTPECDDFRRLDVRERVEAVIGSTCEYDEVDEAWVKIADVRAALTDEATP